MTRVPPLLLAAGAAAAQGLIARGSASTALSRATAGAMAAASAGLLLSSTTAFRRRGTTVDPLAVDRAEALVTTGPFRLTRNPMYTVMAGLLLAHAALRRSWAALLPAAGFVALIDRIQIPAEESALREKFGAAFDAYAAAAPRWICLLYTSPSPRDRG